MSGSFDIAPLIYWATGTLVLVNLANIVWMWLSGPAKKLGDRIEVHSGRLLDHDQRLTSLETAVRGLPAKDELHGLQLALERMHGDVRELRAIMGRMEAVVTRHEDHLLEGKR